MAFDRGKASARFTHLRQKARGVLAGTPDTLLLVHGHMPVWCEVKAPGGKPTPQQEAIGGELMRMGCGWTWARSVEEYYAALLSFGIPMRDQANMTATYHDGCVAAVIERAEAKVAASLSGKPKRGRKPGPRFVASKRIGKAMLETLSDV
jgi:hypothetical protein